MRRDKGRRKERAKEEGKVKRRDDGGGGEGRLHRDHPDGDFYTVINVSSQPIRGKGRCPNKPWVVLHKSPDVPNMG